MTSADSSHTRAPCLTKGALLLVVPVCGLLAAATLSGCGGTGTSAVPPPSCTTGVLAVSVESGGVAAGTAYGRLVFRNHGTGKCSITGFPHVQFTTAGPVAISVAQEPPVPPNPPIVTLTHGQRASASLAWDDGTGDPSMTCPAITKLTVIPPGSSTSVTVPFAIAPYGPICERVYVGAMHAGPTPPAS